MGCETRYRLVGGTYQPHLQCDIDPEIQRELEYGHACIGPGRTRAAYGEWLASQYPDVSEGIRRIVDCYQTSGSNNSCLSQVVSSNATVTLQSDTRCPSFTHYYEQDTSRQQDYTWMLPNMKFALFSSTQGEEGQRLVGRLMHFYYNRLSRPWPEYVAEQVGANADRFPYLPQYAARPTGSNRLNPPQCSNSSDWLRRDITVPGISYQIPLFIPQGSWVPAWYFEEHSKAGFEILKGLISPSDLEQLLNPPNSRDMGIFIGAAHDFREGQIGAFDRCNLRTDDRGGEYASGSNHITILNTSSNSSAISRLNQADAPLTITSSVRAEAFNHTFFHEIGHAIYFRLLNSSARRNIRGLYHWSVEKYHEDPETNRVYAPNYFSRFPDDEQTYGYYGFKNEMEFFADWFWEYVQIRLMGHDPQGPMAARYQLMSEFLSQNGINENAFSMNNIESAFEESGEDININRSSGFSLAVPRFGAQSFYGDVGGTTLHGAVVTIGLQAGYLSRGIERGFIGGIGILFDGSIGLGGLENMGMIDFGAYGRLGGNTGPIDLFVEPALGLRHITGNELNATSFWLGGQAGIGLADGFVNLFFMARGSPTNNWYSLGGGVSLDFATFIRQSR